MARKKKYRRKKKQFTLPIAPLAGFAVGMQPVVDQVIRGDYNNALNYLAANYTGYHPTQKNWSVDRLKNGLVPLVVGGLIHKYIGGNPVGVNRMLAQAGVPVIRL